MAEARFLEKRQLAENQAERLKVQKKLAKVKARSEVYATMQDDAFVKNEVAINEEFKRDQTATNTKITACSSTKVSHHIKRQLMHQML